MINDTGMYVTSRNCEWRRRKENKPPNSVHSDYLRPAGIEIFSYKVSRKQTSCSTHFILNLKIKPYLKHPSQDQVACIVWVSWSLSISSPLPSPSNPSNPSELASFFWFDSSSWLDPLKLVSAVQYQVPFSLERIKTSQSRIQASLSLLLF